jgi:glycyl-tRNA synthetase beta chain
VKIPSRDLLIELGTEELPPKALASLSRAFERLFCEGLKAERLEYAAISRFATPRRLALLVEGLSENQADRDTERFGPAVKAAFDADGAPTKAAQGFAKSCGVEVSELATAEKDGVEKLYFSSVEKGRTTVELVPELISKAMQQLPIPKRMRWGASREEFVRPVHWLTVLFGHEVIPMTLFAVESCGTTRGHRFLSNEELLLDSAADYEQVLEETGNVIPDFDKRRDSVRKLVTAEGEKAGGQVVMDEDLLNEVTSLVEYPVALSGAFDEQYLELPPEALILTLKSHQKCFCITDADGKLLPHFVTVSNLLSKDPAKVIEGNERVIRPRLADARFFFDADRQQSLESRSPSLEKLIFQDKLGTVHDKSARVAELAAWIAGQVGADADKCRRAALLAKCDLLTQMVGEFADLQGLMGYYYALNDGEDQDVARAINEQYQPRQAGGELPSTMTGAILAIADKLDTMVGMFGIGQPPTGSKDPFALRRSAIGILRIIVDRELDLDINQALAQSIASYSGKDLEAGIEKNLSGFVFDRFKAWYAEEGISATIFQSVSSVSPGRPLDFHRRVQAVHKFTGLDEAAALAAANKRVSNLLSKQKDQPDSDAVKQELLQEQAEKDLYEAIQQKQSELAPCFESGDYSAALSGLAGLKAPVDRFFDDVLVMAEDEGVKQNRLNLLRQLRNLFLRTADISHLHND